MMLGRGLNLHAKDVISESRSDLDCTMSSSPKLMFLSLDLVEPSYWLRDTSERGLVGR